MTRKNWIWITIFIAVIHGFLTIIIMPISSDIIFSRFDGNPYQSSWDPLWVGLFFLLNIPYYMLSHLAGPLRAFEPTYIFIWVGNSVAWGLLGAWLISKLPFMRDQEEP